MQSWCPRTPCCAPLGSVAPQRQETVAGHVWERRDVEAGGLMSYGRTLLARGGARPPMWTRFSRGPSRPTLPIEQPTRFELVINLKTAKALAVAIPVSLRLRVDHIIE